MKVYVKNMDSNLTKDDLKLFFKFLKFLYKLYPVKKDVKVLFLNKRIGGMTTGARTKDDVIKILTNKRLNRDIIRTLAHEWVHEYQMTILKRDKGPNIGGKNEDEANSLSGSIVKKFEKKYPQFEGIIYK